MATIRERKPGVCEVRVFVGGDERGRPKQVSRTVRGTKRAAKQLAAELAVSAQVPLECPAPEARDMRVAVVGDTIFLSQIDLLDVDNRMICVATVDGPSPGPS